MTIGTPPPDPRDARLDQWLEQHLTSLTASLNEVVDLDAGLRDARLPDRVQSLDAMLEPVLDLDAGLNAILPSATQPSRPTPPGTSPLAGSGSLLRYAQDLAQRPLRERLTLRSAIPLNELRLVKVVAQQSIACGSLNDALSTPDLDHAESRTRFLGHIRVLALNHAWDHALDLDHVLVFDHARARARDLVRALDRALDLALNVALDLAHARDRVLAHARVCDLVRALDLTRDLIRALTRDLDRTLSRVLALALARNRDRNLVLALDHAPRDELVVGVTSTEAAVTDFTASNLADLDLRGIDLRGVRWSILTTCWPPDWADAIRAASVQLDPGRHPDLYEVRDNPQIRHTVMGGH